MSQESFYRQKITPPTPGQTVVRHQLINSTDTEKQSVVWLTAPAGSGKTVLALQIAHAANKPLLWYNIDSIDNDPAVFFNNLKQAALKLSANAEVLPDITAADLMHIRSFALLFFSQLRTCLDSRFTLVLDNFQHLDESAVLSPLLVHVSASLPDDFCIIVTSRKQHPADWISIEVENRLKIITWEQLRVEVDEIPAFLANHNLNSSLLTDEKLVQQIHRQSDGWIAGIKLLLGNLNTLKKNTYSWSFRSGRDTVFHHFSTVIFQEMDEATKDVLIKTSVLPFLPSQLLNTLCNSNTANNVIKDLYRRRFFISLREQNNEDEQEVYIYHDLLRDFLREELSRQYNTSEHEELYRRAAESFWQAGWRDDALSLWMQAEAWDECLQSIESQAPKFYTTGRSASLLALIEQLPTTYRTKTPILSLWYGICLMPARLQEAKSILKAAYSQFKSSDDRQSLLQCWAANIDALWLEWGDCKEFDQWIDELALLVKKPTGTSNPDSHILAKGAFTAMAMRQMDHPELPYWEATNLQQLDEGLPLNEMIFRALQLMIHYTWGTGNRAKSKLVLNHLLYAMKDERCPEAGQCIYRITASAHCYWFSASVDACLHHVEEGLAAANKYQLPFWNVIMLNVALFKLCSVNDIKRAKTYLELLSLNLSDTSSKNDIAVYYHFVAYIAWLEGDHTAALPAIEKALSLALSTGFSFSPAYYRLAIARIKAGMGQIGQALALVSIARKQAISFQSHNILYTAHLVAADIFYSADKPQRAMRYAEYAFDIGREQHYFCQPWVKNSSFFKLCKLALSKKPDDEYLLSRLEEQTHTNEDAACRIYMLGRHELIKRSNNNNSSRKQAKVPQELLSRLIVAGRGNSCSAEDLIESIWPNTQWDKAYPRLKTAVYRLRQMLDNEEAVIFREGKIRLNEQACWVDCWKFEEITEPPYQIDNDLKDRVFDLYQGEFYDRLGENKEQLFYKSRLELRFQSIIDELAAHYIKLEAWNELLDLYQQALKRDNLNERYFRGLIQALFNSGKKKELAKAFIDYREYIRNKTNEDLTHETLLFYENIAGTEITK